MSAEVIAILDTVLQGRSVPLTIEEIDCLRVHGQRPLTQSVIDLARQRER